MWLYTHRADIDISLSRVFSAPPFDIYGQAIRYIDISTMPEAIDASSIATNYYKLAHLGSVTYLVYTVSSGTSDQTLLELELVIRYAYPKRLITYYNKCLYCFQFNHTENQEDLAKDYPQLELKFFNLVGADLLANPPKPTTKDGNFDNDYLAYASLSFLKAVKKLVLFNLSKSDVVQPFGNYAVLKRKELSNSIVHIDPILLPNGDLLLSVSENCHLQLFESSIVDINQIQSIDLNFVLYIIPSGIRCHLYDNLNIASNFTTDPPKNSEVLIQLIKYSTGVDLKRSDSLVWVKLVPNLQHLNNQTSKISKFIHPVDNKKFILWPWILCILQFGFAEENIIRATDTSSCDPLGLISEFIDFNIGNHQHTNIAGQLNPGHHNNQSFNYSIPSAVSTGMSSTGVDNKGDLNVVGEIPGSVLDIFGIQSSDANDFFNGANLQTQNPEEAKLTSEEPSKKHTDDDDDMEMDDLFGDASEDEKPTMEGSENIEDEGLTENLFNDDGLDSAKDIIKKEGVSKISDVNDNIDVDYNNSEENDILEELKDYKDSKLQNSVGAQNTFIDIPKDQMTIPSFKNLKQTPQIYNDPGAPMPIIPTPIFPQSGINSVAPFSSQSINPPTGTENEANDGARSIFSPILFNPIIKSNIDTKYGKGGKFYVDKEVSAGPDIDSKRRSFRATSVNGFELPLRKDESVGIEAVNEDTKLILELSEEQGNIEEVKIHDQEETNKKNSLSNLDDINNNEIDDNDDEDEESDEDEDLNMEVNDLNLKRSPPLKLNIHNDPYIAHLTQVGLNLADLNHTGKSLLANSYNASSLNTGGFSSPNSLGFNNSKLNAPLKYDSPLGFNNLTKEDQTQTASPVVESGVQADGKTMVSENFPIGSETDVEKKSSDKQTEDSMSGVNTPNSRGSIVSESSNCLPLILRGINVSSIPSFFILTNTTNNMSIPTNFDMDMEDENESSDYELSKNNEMIVKLNNLDEFLKWLGPNLIFDMGLNKLQKSLIMKLPNNERKGEEIVNVEGKSPSKFFEKKLYDIFPLSYRVNLNEFTTDTSFNDSKDQSNPIQDELDNQLSFLDEITNEDILNPKTQLKKLNSIEWDSIYPENGKNEENSKSYKEIVHNVGQSSLVNTLEDGTIFPLANNKARVLKHDTILNLNSTGIKFWKYLNFSPLNGPKNFQLLLISEHDYNMLHLNYNMDFVNSVVYNYKECGFGSISKINLQPSDSRPDLEGIENGLLLVGRENSEQGYGNIYKQINHKLNKLVELIKLDLINKTNRFEFDRPLLLLFINFDKSVNSLLQISKLIRNFKLFLSHHQLPLVEVFAHIIPASLIIKQSGGHRRLKFLSNIRLSKLSMNLYNQCPNECTVGNTIKDPTKHLFTQLFREPPSNLNFKFMNNGSSGNGKTTFNDDIFLHLAYERSIDKNWVSAAWSDPLGIAVSTKSWNCSPTLQKSGNKNVHSLEAISDEIWNTSIILFKKLNDEVIKRTSGLGGKKFLVLTRINSIIPDDELIHWKRLSIKHKDISLIVLSVNKLPKLLFTGPLASSQADEKVTNGSNSSAATSNIENNPSILSDASASGGPTSNALAPDFFKNFSNSYTDNSPQNNNSGTMSVSPSNNGGINFHSPQQFLNVPGNFLSPQDLVSSAGGSATGNNTLPSHGQDMADVIVHDPTEELTAVIPRAPLPSFNSPTRLGMKIGYLIKDVGVPLSETTKQYLVYEVNLLSCSNYWNLNAIMRILLNQYKKLITLNDILCVGDIDGNISGDSTEEDKTCASEKNSLLNNIASGLVPWHIAAVSKSLDYLVHIDVEE